MPLNHDRKSRRNKTAYNKTISIIHFKTVKRVSLNPYTADRGKMNNNGVNSLAEVAS